MEKENEKTLLIIKPDATKKKFIGSIINFFETKGLNIIEIKSKNLKKEEAREFYKEHKDRVFFNELIEYICSGLVVGVCFSGKNSVELVRKMIGETDPKKANEGTVRRLFGEDINSNAVHASDSIDSAYREINFFFN